MKIYNIGDAVWVSRHGVLPTLVMCQDCLGTCAMKFIMPDGEEHAIDCQGCKRGYESPTGLVTIYKYEANAVQDMIRSVRVEKEGVEYITESHYCYKGWEVFDNKEDAELHSEALTSIHNENEEKKPFTKYKDTKSWAWHVHYYRKMIRDAEEKIIYAKKCLDVSKIKAKAQS